MAFSMSKLWFILCLVMALTHICLTKNTEKCHYKNCHDDMKKKGCTQNKSQYGYCDKDDKCQVGDLKHLPDRYCHGKTGRDDKCDDKKCHRQMKKEGCAQNKSQVGYCINKDECKSQDIKNSVDRYCKRYIFTENGAGKKGGN